MMDEELRQTMVEVREMKQMCGNINMKLNNIVTQRGQDWKKKLEAEYQRGLEDGKAVHEKGCEGCEHECENKMTQTCILCCNAYKNRWIAKSDKIEVGDEVNNIYSKLKGVVTQIIDDTHMYALWQDGSTGIWNVNEVTKTGRHFDIKSILEAMKK